MRVGPVRVDGLADNIAYQLRLAQEASFETFAALTGESGLRPGRYAMLRIIGDNPGVSQTELSRAIGRDKTTLTPSLADMERGGLILRETDPFDRRTRRLSLTPRGDSMLGRLTISAQQHDSRLDSILGVDDKVALLRLLRRVTAGLAQDRADAIGEID